MKRFRIGKRGISPIVGSLLMLLVTVIAFATVIGYANTFMSAQRANALTTIRERLAVEDVWFKLNNTVTLSVTNVGKAPVKILEVHINNENVAFNPSPLKINVLELREITVSFSWVSGTEYSFIIVSEGGYYLQFSSTPL